MVSSAGSLVGILSMLVGMLVSFRVSSSYDRCVHDSRTPLSSLSSSGRPVERALSPHSWYEGRRTWAALTGTTRTLLRLLVFALPPPSKSPHDAHRTEAVKELCSLICAFPYACMYRLRDMPGLTHPELRQLLPATLLEAYASTPASARRPSISSQSSSSFVEHSVASESERALAGLNTTPSPLRIRPHALPTGEPSNLPLSLIRATHAYLTAWHETKLPSRDAPDENSAVLDGATWAACTNAMKDYTDQLTALERIRDSAWSLFLARRGAVDRRRLSPRSAHPPHPQHPPAAPPLCLHRRRPAPARAHNRRVVCPRDAIAAAVFFGLNSAAEELSDPFGVEPCVLFSFHPFRAFCSHTPG